MTGIINELMHCTTKELHLKKYRQPDGLKIVSVSGTQVETEVSHDKNILPFTEFL